jgi:hypothetical protein
MPSDHDTLVEIWLRAVRATHHFLTNGDIEKLLGLVRQGALDGLEIWVLCGNGPEPIGFMGLSDSKVEALFLAPEYHRRFASTKRADLSSRAGRNWTPAACHFRSYTCDRSLRMSRPTRYRWQSCAPQINAYLAIPEFSRDVAGERRFLPSPNFCQDQGVVSLHR